MLCEAHEVVTMLLSLLIEDGMWLEHVVSCLDENVVFKKYTSSLLLMLVCWRTNEVSQSVVPGKVYEADVGWNKWLSWAWLCVPTLNRNPSANHGLLFMPNLWLYILRCLSITYATSATRLSFQQYRNWEESDVADCQTCSAANGVNKPTLRCVAQWPFIIIITSTSSTITIPYLLKQSFRLLW